MWRRLLPQPADGRIPGAEPILLVVGSVLNARLEIPDRVKRVLVGTAVDFLGWPEETAGRN
jgi:hypothetical protein